MSLPVKHQEENIMETPWAEKLISEYFDRICENERLRV